MKHRLGAFLLPVVFLVVFVTAAFFAAELVAESERARELVESFGVFGVIIVAVGAGMSIGVPVPAASFTPVFLTSGLSLTTAVAGLAIGITIADSINYSLGRYGRAFSKKYYPGFFERLQKIHDERRWWIVPGMFLYAAFIPIPNEAVLIPLALMGYPYRYLIVPILLGNIISQLILALIFSNTYRLLF